MDRPAVQMDFACQGPDKERNGEEWSTSCNHTSDHAPLVIAPLSWNRLLTLRTSSRMLKKLISATDRGA